MGLPTCPLPETADLAYACRSSFSEVVSLGQDLVDGSVPFETLAVEEGSQLMEAAGPAFLTVSVKRWSRPVSATPFANGAPNGSSAPATLRQRRHEPVARRRSPRPGDGRRRLRQRIDRRSSDEPRPAPPALNESGLRAHTVSDAGQGGVTGLFLAAAGGCSFYFASARGALPVGIGLAASGVAIAGVSFSPRRTSRARFLRAWLRCRSGADSAPASFSPEFHGYHGGASGPGPKRP